MVLRVFMILLFLVVMAGVAVRFIPVNPTEWHVDPTQADDPGSTGALLSVEDSPVWSQSPEELMAAFDAIALATPRTEMIGGAASEGFATYMTSSLIWGFPDFTSVRAVETEDGTRLAVFARLRFGAYDLGVNQSRVDDWLAQLTAAVPPQ